MEITTLNTLFNYIGIIAALLVVISTIGTFWTGKIIEEKNDTQIVTLKTQIGTLSPRTLSEQQKTVLIRKLSASKGTKIGFITKLLDPESKDFAIQLSSVFKEAGWNVEEPINQTLLDDFNGLINIFAKPELEAAANVVYTALNEVGLPCEPQSVRDGAISGTLNQDIIYLAIGSKTTKR